MKTLILKKEDRLDVEFKEEVAKRSYAVALLMKKDIEAGDYRYRKQVNEQMNSLIAFCASAKSSLNTVD